MTATESGGPRGTVRADVPATAETKAEAGERKPAWLDRFVWDALWKVVAVAFAVTVLLTLASRAQDLLRLLVISVFFALALVPAVKHMHERWGWKRGAAVGVIYAGLIVFVALMVLVLVPGIAEFADQVRTNSGDWADQLNARTEDLFGATLIDQSAAEGAGGVTDDALRDWAGNILGLASSGIGLIFSLATIGLFTFYFAADYDRIERALMSRMPPHRQQVYGWVSDTALEQTGGYFYSRLLLMVINGVLFFAAMLLIGVPLAFALPLSVFEAFVSTFIPAVGTYIGAAVPIVVTLAIQGLVAAAVLLVWTIIYQQLENYWLSPKISAETMELNGGVAFGAALAGGAIAGPMGAFMSLPVAALITAIIKNAGKTYDVVYHSKYEGREPETPTAQVQDVSAPSLP
jgi:predicted PurR-regulated permease PerM